MFVSVKQQRNLLDRAARGQELQPAEAKILTNKGLAVVASERHWETCGHKHVSVSLKLTEAGISEWVINRRRK